MKSHAQRELDKWADQEVGTPAEKSAMIDALWDAIEQDTAEAKKRVWHGPLRSASGWKETEPGKYAWSPDEKIFVDGRCYIVEVPE